MHKGNLEGNEGAGKYTMIARGRWWEVQTKRCGNSENSVVSMVWGRGNDVPQSVEHFTYVISCNS